MQSRGIRASEPLGLTGPPEAGNLRVEQVCTGRKEGTRPPGGNARCNEGRVQAS